VVNGAVRKGEARGATIGDGTKEGVAPTVCRGKAAELGDEAKRAGTPGESGSPMLRRTGRLAIGEPLGERRLALGVASLDGTADCGGTVASPGWLERYGVQPTGTAGAASTPVVDQAHGPMGLELRGGCRLGVAVLRVVEERGASDNEVVDFGGPLTGDATADRGGAPHAKPGALRIPPSTMPAVGMPDKPGRATIDVGRE